MQATNSQTFTETPAGTISQNNATRHLQLAQCCVLMDGPAVERTGVRSTACRSSEALKLVPSDSSQLDAQNCVSSQLCSCQGRHELRRRVQHAYACTCAAAPAGEYVSRG